MPITGFKVYRNGTLVASPASSPYVDTGLTNGQSYSYQVSAVSEVGEGPKSATVTAVPTAPSQPAGNSVTVSSVSALKQALLNNNLDEIVMTNGTYHVSPSASQLADSLWIGSAYASRTRSILVRAQTNGGVVFDGGGATSFGGISFNGGAHHQTWRGFKFTNGVPTQAAITIAGYPDGAAAAACHDITLQNIEVSGLITNDALRHGYAIYFSASAAPGPYNIIVEDCTFIDSGAHKALLHWYHDSLQSGDPPNFYNTQSGGIVRRCHLFGSPQPVIIWARTVNGLLIEDVDIHDAGEYAIRYEHGTVTLRRVTSVGSTLGGFYSSQGANPPGVTKIDCSLA